MLISSPKPPRAEASAERTHQTGSASIPESTRAKSPRSACATAERAAARIQGSRSATSPTSRWRSGGVGRQDGERAQALAPHDVARGGQHRRCRRRAPRVADRAERPQRALRHRLVGVADEGQEQLDRRGVLERPEAARAEGAREGVVGRDRGHEDGPQLRALEAHRHPRRRPPVEARAGAVEEGARGRQGRP